MQDFDMVLFGGTGDLVMRKLLPALFYLHRDGHMSACSRILGVARPELTRERYLEQVEAQCRPFIEGELDGDEWRAFLSHLDYHALDANLPEAYAALAEALGEEGSRVRVYYLSVGPSLFAPICANLGAAGLVTPNARVVVEKPLGHDLASSQAINDEIGKTFAEGQIFRIDHYLGKEPVQNLLALRFGNALFEPLWRREWVSDVQITVAEDIGVGTRGAFYDQTGALRDMVQNHLLQLLCIVAMDPPSSIDADQVRDEKVKVLRALRPFAPHEIATRTVRGQYRAGACGGQPVCGYLDEIDVPAGSTTETFVAIKAEIDTWRWAGVPFYLRTGKRMSEKLAEIVINFRAVPHFMFGDAKLPNGYNRLVIRMQPDESVQLHLLAKQPGDVMKLQPVHLNLALGETSGQRRMEAYERLLLDAVRGRLTLFVRRDEQEAAWRWIAPIGAGWRDNPDSLKPYTAGTYGPAAASALLSRDGLNWHGEL